MFSFQSCFFCCLLVVSYVINYVKIFLERKIRLSSPFLCAVNPNFLTRTEQQLPGCSSEFLLTGSYRHGFHETKPIISPLFIMFFFYVRIECINYYGPHSTLSYVPVFVKQMTCSPGLECPYFICNNTSSSLLLLFTLFKAYL